MDPSFGRQGGSLPHLPSSGALIAAGRDAYFTIMTVHAASVATL
jgi:hypothetical protein